MSRVDENQQSIVVALRKVGATVASLASVGHGCPDLIVGYRRVNYLMEIKNPEKVLSQRHLTPEQKLWHSMWKGHVSLIETIDEALICIGAIKNGQDNQG